MAWLNRIWNTLRSRSLQDELDEELRLHLDLRAQELERAGMSHDAARAAATRQFGNTTLQTERMRRMDVAAWMETLFGDLRYAMRQFRRNPLFSSIAILSLALGIGANTAIFSVMNAVLLRALPVRDPQQLVILTNPDSAGSWTGITDPEREQISYPEFVQLRERLTTLSGLCVAEASLGQWQIRISGGQQEEARGRLVSENYFSVLGVEAAIGRVFSQQDEAGPGQDPFVVISYDYWQRRFGGRSDVLGANITLNRGTLTVIGVAGPGFRGESAGDDPDLWIPVLMSPLVYPGQNWLHEDPSHYIQKHTWLHAFGRLKPGATVASVQTEANVVFKAMMEAFYPPTLPPDLKKEALSQHLVVRDARTGAFNGRDGLTGQLTILLAVAGLVLLIACANVANLLLARATARGREVAIRLSIGASRMRLFRQFLTESLLLSLLGGAAGLFMAWGGARFLVRIFTEPDQQLSLSTGLGGPVLAFTAAVTLLTGILFGIAPSLRASRTNVNAGLRETGQGVTRSRGRLNVAKSLVIVQVALSLLLVIGAGLFLRTLWNLQTIALGYPKENLLQVHVDGVATGYKGPALADYYHEVAGRLGALPGVRGVTYSENGLMAGGESNTHVVADGFTPQRDEDREARYDQVGPGYFAVLGIPVLLGRELGPQDTATSARVCVVNEELAKRFFAGRNPIGLHLTRNHDDGASLEIVGVVKNSRSRSLVGEIPQRFYVPVDQGSGVQIAERAVFEIRTVGDPKSMANTARKTILSVNPDAPIVSSRSMDEVIENETFFPRLIARLSAIFGGLALLMAAIGLYGVLSYGVARRTNEIGIRMALGAGRGSVIGMILRETGVLVVIGLVAGIAAAAGCTHLIASQLYGLGELDPATFVVAVGLLGAVAFIAGYIPAARAAKVNPVQALRHE
jgi:predicted permease